MCPGRADQTVIEAQLSAEGDQTRLVIEERGLPLGELAAHGAGWQAHVEDLAAHIAGRAAADWRSRWTELTPPTEIWRATSRERVGPVPTMTADAAVLLTFLNAQRARALAIVADLDADQLAKPVLASSWTPLGMIEHLGHAERHWFQEVALGSVAPLPWPDDPAENADGPFSTTRPPDAVFAFYRDQIERANAVASTTPLSTPPQGRHNHGNAEQVTDLSCIVLHMIEETGRHLGHLDAARELIDGRTGLGQDDL